MEVQPDTQMVDPIVVWVIQQEGGPGRRFVVAEPLEAELGPVPVHGVVVVDGAGSGGGVGGEHFLWYAVAGVIDCAGPVAGGGFGDCTGR